MNPVGRADLITYLQRWGKEGLDHAALSMGFYRPPKPGKVKEEEPKKKIETGGVISAGPEEFKEKKPSQETELLIPFWRVVKYREKETTETQWEVPAWLEKEKAFTDGEIRAGYTEIPPPKIPLLPWSRMWPFLFAVLGNLSDTQSIDIDGIVRLAAKGEPLRELPYKKRLTWAGTGQLILDMDSCLLPFWDDENSLREGIEKIRGSSGLEVLVFERGPDKPCRRWGNRLGELRPYRFPGQGTPILVVSDLGCLDKEIIGQQESPQEKSGNSMRLNSWLNFGKRLQRAGFSPTALLPCPTRLWNRELSCYWHLACWDRGERLPQIEKGRVSPGYKHHHLELDDENGTERLLGLLSAAVRVEPILLRAVRFLLSKNQADAAAEVSAWGHRHTLTTPLAFSFDKNAVNHYRNLFRENPSPLKEQVIALIKKYHARLSPAIQAEEDLVAALLLERDEKEYEETQGHTFLKRVVKTQYDRRFSEQQGMEKWLDRLCSRLPLEVWNRDYVLTAAWVKLHKENIEKGQLSIPFGMDIQKAAWVWGPPSEPKQWCLRRKGEVLTADRQPWVIKENPDGWDDNGSPLVILTMANPWLTIKTTKKQHDTTNVFHLEAPKPVKMAVHRVDRIILDTDHEQVVIEFLTSVKGAREIRRDKYGLSAVFTDSEGERRLYWLNPGKYAVLPSSNSLYIKKGCWLDEKEFHDWWHYGIIKPDWADSLGIDKYGLYADFIIKNIVQRMRFIVPGEFLMGSPENEPKRYDNEVLHEVMLTRGFWLADTTCTQALWQIVMRENPSEFKGGERPVERVSWDDCQPFIEKINKLRIGLNLRLPTEAEWEYACRAGTQTPFWFGDNITPDIVNYNGYYPYAEGKKGKYREETVEVKSLPCNGWGLYQMHGNVWEWCSDWYREYPKGGTIDPKGPFNGDFRVLRGGGWVADGGDVRSACRDRLNPSGRFSDDGFRLARGQR